MRKNLLITVSALVIMMANVAKAADCPDDVCDSGYTCQCNSSGKITEKIDKYGDRYSYTYDANGHMLSETVIIDDDINGDYIVEQHQWTYDANGRVTSVDGGESEKYVYDKNGKLTYEYSWGGNGGQSYAYDENGHLIAKQDHRYGSENSIEYYDENGNTTATVRGDMTTFYDSGKPMLSLYGDGRKVVYTYGKDGEKTSEAFYRPNGTLSSINTYDHGTHNAIMYYDKDGKFEWAEGRMNATESDIDCSGGGYVQGCTGASQDAIQDAINFYEAPHSSPSVVCATGYVPGCTGASQDAINNYPGGPIICATGYVEGCIGEDVTLPDGTSATMKNGIISSSSPDGSTTLYNEDGSIKGFKGKRIFTIDEANEVAGKTNSFKIRYR